MNVGSQELSGSHVAATVNSSPIFVSDILDRYQAKLDESRGQMSDREYQKVCMALVKRDLPSMIENRLLVDALKSTLEPEQLEQMQTQLDRMFNLQIDEWKKKYGVNSALEVEMELASDGASVQTLREEFATQTMAREYLKAKSNVKSEVSRAELIAEYKSRLDEFAHPARVRWQQIVIKFSKHGGQDGATQVLSQAVDALRANTPFAQVAQKFSDGPTAKQGGDRDWIQSGSLANEEVDNALFTLPVGGISQSFTSRNEFQIVRVLERESAHYTPFEEVQDQLEEEILTDLRKDAFQKVLDDLKEDAIVVTMFDEESQASNTSLVPLIQ